jgi:hypothetical protein
MLPPGLASLLRAGGYDEVLAVAGACGRTTHPAPAVMITWRWCTTASRCVALSMPASVDRGSVRCSLGTCQYFVLSRMANRESTASFRTGFVLALVMPSHWAAAEAQGMAACATSGRRLLGVQSSKPQQTSQVNHLLLIHHHGRDYSRRIRAGYDVLEPGGSPDVYCSVQGTFSGS